MIIDKSYLVSLIKLFIFEIFRKQWQIGFYKHQNIERKIIIQEFQFHENRILAFSMDGKFLASGGDDSAICLVDIENKSLVVKIFSNGGKVMSLVFINNHLDFVDENEYGNVNLIQFTKQNIRRVKVIQNEPIGMSSVNSSLKAAQILSNHGYDITNCFLIILVEHSSKNQLFLYVFFHSANLKNAFQKCKY